MPGRPSPSRPPTRPSHAPSLPGPRASDGRPEQDSGNTRKIHTPSGRQQGLGLSSKPRRLTLSTPARLAFSSHLRPFAQTFPDGTGLSRNLIPLMQPFWKIPGTGAKKKKKKTSGTNFLDPSAPAGACWMGEQEEGKITSKGDKTCMSASWLRPHNTTAPWAVMSSFYPCRNESSESPSTRRV